jgi:hypothetical protein
VEPTGAQVLRTLGMRRNPLSSRKTRWAPRRAACFYMGPRVPLPVLDRWLVPLGGAALGLLPTPPQPVAQQRPHPDQRVPYPKLRLDQLGDALEGPQFRAVPAGLGAPQQLPFELLLLALRQSGWPPRRRPRAQSLQFRRAIRLPPAHHRAQRRLHRSRHVPKRPSRLQQRHRSPAALLQMSSRARRSHAS